MSLPVALSVRLATTAGDIHVTDQLRELTFRETAIGGWASARMSLDRPLNVQPNEIGYYGKAYIYDARSGLTVWEGRLEDPGRGARADGQVWELSAVGPAAHTLDRTVPLVYVDDPMRDLIRCENVTPGGRDTVGGDPGNTGGNQEALVLQLPQGLGIVTDSRVCMRYGRLMESGQKLARVDHTWDAGITSASLLVELICRTDGGAGDNARSDSFNVAGGGSAPKEIVTDWTSGRNTADWRIRWTGGSTTVGNDTSWASIRNMVVVATRYNQSGTELLTAADYSANTVLASEVVADLLGRLLTGFDGAGASVATTSYAIDQLAYPDGTTAAKVLEDLMAIEPDYRWGAYESNSAGKYRFEWAQWPTTVRYETDSADGFDSPGSADGLYNAVRLRWRDNKGAIKGTQRTSTVTELTAAGLTREAFLDLGDDIASTAQANQVGDKFLAAHASAPNAGRLTVARPIYDITNGRRVMPWEIKAGELIRVRGVQPRVDALNATARDGVTIFRIWAKEYSAADAAATLELDSSYLTTARMLADLARNRITRRR